MANIFGAYDELIEKDREHAFKLEEINNMDLKEQIYSLMDSFLVEGDKPRPIERLNQYRHLFAKNMLALFQKQMETENARVAKGLSKLILKYPDLKKEITSILYLEKLSKLLDKGGK